MLAEGLKKAYNVLFSIRRNIAYNVKPNTKVSLYKSLVLPIVTYGLFCAKQSKATMNALERFQKGYQSLGLIPFGLIFL